MVSGSSVDNIQQAFKLLFICFLYELILITVQDWEIFACAVLSATFVFVTCLSFMKYMSRQVVKTNIVRKISRNKWSLMY